MKNNANLMRRRKNLLNPALLFYSLTLRFVILYVSRFHILIQAELFNTSTKKSPLIRIDFLKTSIFLIKWLMVLYFVII